MKNKLFLLIIISFSLIAISCDNSDDGSDFSDTYVKFYNEKEEIAVDTISFKINTINYITVRSQSKNGKIPKVFKQIDKGERIEITDNTTETTTNSQSYGSGYRETRTLIINLNEKTYSVDQTIVYIVKAVSMDENDMYGSLVIKVIK